MDTGLYQHYKGKFYQVISVAKHSESLEEMVVYRSLYGDYSLWVRPKGIFLEKIIFEGKERTRFEFIRPLDKELQEIE
jgi:hypothetical protein